MCLNHVMQDHFSHIQNKLEQFIKRYYINELLKGAILFFAIGLLYFLFTLLVEYAFWLNPMARTVLFWLFIGVELALFVKFIAIPVAKLLKFQKGINYEEASKIIGAHFHEVNDKLLNVLQLKKASVQSELLLASIEQKSAELRPIPFRLAVNFKHNAKYLKYAAIPVAVLLVAYVSGHFNLFSESYERVLNYKTAYEPPAPFRFYVLNDKLQTIENKDFKLLVKTSGKVIPENVQILFESETHFMRQTAPGQFEFDFERPKHPTDFHFEANGVRSKNYELEIINAPALVNFEMLLDYPAHTKKQDETIKSTGNATVPEGTTIIWKAHTRTTDRVSIYAKDTLHFSNSGDNLFEASKRLFHNFDYSISTSNAQLPDYENLAFSINIVKDAYPELNLKAEKDSIDGQTLYFYGQVSDDYGLTKLQLVYYPVGDDLSAQAHNLPITSGNFDEFVTAFPNQLKLKEGVDYELYFQVFDNDAVHNFKSTKSTVFNYRKLTAAEEETKQLNEQNETIKDMGKSFDKLKEQEQQLKELSKTQKEKNELNFNDKKKFENFLQRQKQQEEMMKNFNKRLQDNLEKFQPENQTKDEFKEELQERLKENEAQLEKDEKLLEELEKLRDKLQKEDLSDKLEQLAKQNKNKQKSLEQLLELTKRYYVAKKAEKLANDLEELSKEQEALSNEAEKDNTSEKQENLNQKFEDFQKEMDALQKENQALKKPMDIPQDKEAESEIKKDQQEATDSLEEKEKNEGQNNGQQAQKNAQSAQQKQKSAAKKMKQMGAQMQMAMMSGSGDQMSEDADMLRQILDNLLLFSFEQEKLMGTFRNIQINSNDYGKNLRKQNNLREHFEHIDDSLFALSLRQPKISETINAKITDVFFNIDKSLNELSENQLYKGVSTQQYTITAANDLANFLSDVLDNMEEQMNPGSGQGQGKGKGQGQGQGSGMQLPDIIMSQEQLKQQMEQGLQNGKDGNEPQDNQGSSNSGGEGSDGEGDKSKGQDGKNGKGNKDGKGDNQHSDGDPSGEELNGEIYEIYQRQQQLRQALEDRLGNAGKTGEGRMLLQKMEEVEMDLINKGFTNQTLQKMMDVQHRLLRLENATFLQEEDNRRKSETNRKNHPGSSVDQIEKAKAYFNTTEILNRQALPLRHVYKKKVQEYFIKTDD